MQSVDFEPYMRRQRAFMIIYLIMYFLDEIIGYCAACFVGFPDNFLWLEHLLCMKLGAEE